VKVVVQRVSRASVIVKGEKAAEIGTGLVVLLAAESGDTDADAEWMANRIAGLRVFNDEDGKLNLSVRDAGGKVLVVSNFTVAGDCTRGMRPSFVRAAEYAEGERLYETFCARLSQRVGAVERGVFGADMQVELINDGPVTLVVDSSSGKDG